MNRPRCGEFKTLDGICNSMRYLNDTTNEVSKYRMLIFYFPFFFIDLLPASKHFRLHRKQFGYSSNFVLRLCSTTAVIHRTKGWILHLFSVHIFTFIHSFTRWQKVVTLVQLFKCVHSEWNCPSDQVSQLING